MQRASPRVLIDNQTGRRLAGFPSDPARAHQEICEFWPSEFAKLFREAGLPRPAPPPLAESSASRAATHTAVAGPRIVSPRAGRVYQIRVSSPDADTLDLEASSETARDQLYWFVDSSYLGTSTASTPLSWKPVAGRHTIRAVDELGRADARTIDVVTVE